MGADDVESSLRCGNMAGIKQKRQCHAENLCKFPHVCLSKVSGVRHKLGMSLDRISVLKQGGDLRRAGGWHWQSALPPVY